MFSSLVSGLPAAAKTRRKTHSTTTVHAANVRVDTAILRSGPNRKSKATALLDAGRKARVIERQKGWLKLRLDSGREGWVRADLLEVSRKEVAREEEERPSSKSRKKYARKAEKPTKRVVAKQSTPSIAKKPSTAPKVATVATKPVQALPPELVAAARQPFLRGALLRPAQPENTALDTAVAEKAPEEVTVESDIPEEMLLPEPMTADGETVAEAPETTTEVVPSAVPTANPVALARNENIVRSALSYRGMPYRRGATGRGAFDCSGFTRYILNQHGASLPRTAAEQYHRGASIQRNALQPGDLVFFKNTYKRGISHVGIYIGDNRFIHASSPRSGVTVSSLSTSYYDRHYAGARRVR